MLDMIPQCLEQPHGLGADGSVHFCVDFRKVNAVSKCDSLLYIDALIS